MKDDLQRYLESECKVQAWVRHHLTKIMVCPERIDALSISAVRLKREFLQKII
jgi:hypothetical protein